MILIRHAEALLWAGRYLERAETTARCVDQAARTVMHLLPDEAEIEWTQLIRGLGLAPEGGEGANDQQATVRRLLTAAQDPGSVRFSVEALRNNLRIVRDRIPVELWEEANRLHLWIQTAELDQMLDTASHEAHSTLRRGCQTMSGVIAEAMPRDAGHAFIVIGRMLERSILTVGLLQAMATHPSGTFDGERLLRATSSLQAFRRGGGDPNDPLAATRLLLEAPTLPRSVLSCLLRTEERISVLTSSAATFEDPLRVVSRLRSRLEFGEVADGLTTALVPTLHGVSVDLSEIAVIVADRLAPPMGGPAFHAQYVRPGRSER